MKRMNALLFYYNLTFLGDSIKCVYTLNFYFESSSDWQVFI